MGWLHQVLSCVTPCVAPAVTGVSPSSGGVAGGTPVTISGSGFTGATSVDFGGTNQPTFTAASDTSITCNTPAVGSAGVVDVRVTTPCGQSPMTAADQFTYTGGGGPTIVQHYGAYNSDTPSMVINWPNPTTDGSCLILVAYIAGGGSPTPPAGWTLVGSQSGPSMNMTWIYQAANATSRSTDTFTLGGNFGSVFVAFEISGLTTQVVDQTGAGSGNMSPMSVSTGGPTATATEIVIIGWGCDNVAPVTLDPSYTLIQELDDGMPFLHVAASYKVVTATGVQSGTYTLSGNDSWAAYIATLP